MPAPAPAPPGSDLVTSVAPSTYRVGSVELGGWNALTDARWACGFGLLQQDTRLDAANTAHAGYQAQNTVLQNRIVFSHFEESNLPGFSGVNPLERAWAQGWPRTSGVAEIIAALHATYTNGRSSPLNLTRHWAAKRCSS